MREKPSLGSNLEEQYARLPIGEFVIQFASCPNCGEEAEQVTLHIDLDGMIVEWWPCKHRRPLR